MMPGNHPIGPRPESAPQLAELLEPADYTIARRPAVILKISRAQLPAAWKRTLYGKWLLLVGAPITARALDDVIGRRERFNHAPKSRS